MPSKREEAHEEADATVKTPRRRSSISTSSSTSSSDPSSTATPNVTEAKPPASVGASVGATPASDSAPATALPVTETPYGAEEEIRCRAYELYEQDGHQDGRAHDHWLRAEAEVLGRANEARANEARVNDARASDVRASQRVPRRTQKSA